MGFRTDAGTRRVITLGIDAELIAVLVAAFPGDNVAAVAEAGDGRALLVRGDGGVDEGFATRVQDSCHGDGPASGPLPVHPAFPGLERTSLAWGETGAVRRPSQIRGCPSQLHRCLGSEDGMGVDVGNRRFQDRDGIAAAEVNDDAGPRLRHRMGDGVIGADIDSVILCRLEIGNDVGVAG